MLLFPGTKLQVPPVSNAPGQCSPSVFLLACATCGMLPVLCPQSPGSSTIAQRSLAGYSRQVSSCRQVLSTMDMGGDLFMVHLQEIKVPVKMIK